MDLALLHTFVAVHRAGSFTRAAALLGLSQPAVTSQIRTLEKQLGRPLFLRQARGVTPTSIGEELALKAAPHLDALLEIADAGVHQESGTRTLHLVGPPEFTTLRVLPTLTGPDTLLHVTPHPQARGPRLRVSFVSKANQAVEGLAGGLHDLAITTARPRSGPFTATALCDEEHVLVASPARAKEIDLASLATTGPAALDGVPVIEVHASLPLVARYWAAVFDTCATAPAAVVAPDLRAVRACVRAGAGVAVLPRYLCEADLAQGQLIALLEPAVPPLRTYFLVVRTGTLGRRCLAWAHERLLRAASAW
ncbi:LysR family transcriptional regulator [Streptomyces sp. NPDC006879]|uniref:LysR family transcriptional regulator n=1 Tax=Streptomyces sp. NPDC006879 TaxID=3364767 RepID=UPI00368A8800